MKPDVQKALLATAGRYIRKLFGEVEPRIKALEDQSEIAIKLLDRIDVLEKALVDRPMPERGEPGPQGERGADAEPVLVADIVGELISTKALEPVLDLCATEAVAKYLEANPVRDGKDGQPGPSGPRGAEGPAGKDGRDGLDVRDMLRNIDGHLVAVMSDGTTRDLGEIRNGQDGSPGKDGADFSGAEIDYDGERTIIIKGAGGEIRRIVPVPLDRGYYRDGMRADKGDILTHDGNAWIALRDTKAKPCYENAEDWRLFARRGRDGRDGKDVKPTPGPVQLKGNGDA